MSKIGPVMLDIESTQLSKDDQKLLSNRQVGGVILFSRNFSSAAQLFDLTQSIKAINPQLIIAVDQEGGRVQRFKNDFSILPAMGLIGQLYREDAEAGANYAMTIGELMALEVQSSGCDISFAPVLDLGFRTSRVIGDRAFSTEIEIIVMLAGKFIDGMAKAGMGATGKHFPGHGSVEADSHFEIPVDNRRINTIKNKDMQPFVKLKSKLDAIMPAHVIYADRDIKPAGFSSVWLKQILRQEIGFDGVIFSDDLSMKAAEVAGDFAERAEQALKAGCDMVLVCNDRSAAKQVVDSLGEYQQNLKSHSRLSKLLMTQEPQGLDNLKRTERWKTLNQQLMSFKERMGLPET